VLGEDTEGNIFRISPLQGELFATRFPAGERASLPDSLSLLTEDERLLTRSAAVLHVFRRLVGLWLLMAMIMTVIPQMFLCWCYDQLAFARKRFFGPRQDFCPVLSVELRKRFDA